ncbi:MAG: T9SS type A sorting domain-containing protein [Bacteroidota bacterium]
MKRFLLLLIQFTLATNLLAQRYIQKGVPSASPDFRLENEYSPLQFRMQQQDSLENITTITYQERFETTNWQYPELTFMPEGVGQFAGDINGDGIDDLVRPYYWVFDLEAENPSDKVHRSLVFYGGTERKLFPDDYIDIYLEPIGDVNGDGFSDALGRDTDRSYDLYQGSANGYQYAGDFALNLDDYGYDVPFNDYNGDGFDDLLFYQSLYDSGTVYNVMFGSADDFGKEVHRYFVPGKSGRAIYVQFSGKNLVYDFVVEGGEKRQLAYTAYELNPDFSEPILRFSGTYDISNYDPSFIDKQAISANKDNMEDVLIYFRNKPEYTGVNLLLMNSKEGLTDTILDLSTDKEWAVLGDVNADGLTDFICEYTDSTGTIGVASANPDYKINLDEELAFDVHRRNSISAWDGYFFGDIDGDGFDDFQLYISNELTRGNRTFYGSSTAALERKEDVLYLKTDFFPDPEFRSSRALKDWNNDGWEDFAILYANRIDIHYGGDEMTVPKFTISVDKSHFATEMAIGDFTGDGFEDIALTVRYFTDAGSQKEVHFYYGSKNPDTQVDHIIKSPLSESSYSFTMSVSNIGDFNGDGIDDIATVSTGWPEAFIFLGGSSISEMEPDIIIDLPSIYDQFDGGRSNSIPLFSYFLHNVGDLNGDNIDDLVISALDYEIEGADRQSWGTAGGGVAIIYGKRKYEDILKPDLYLVQKDLVINERLESFGWHLTGADFNGDGYNDLIVMPEHFSKKENELEAINGVFIYHGGPDFDEVIDNSFKLPSAPFGGSGEYLAEFRGELIRIPDLDKDGSDELLVTTSIRNRNAALFMGGETYDFEADAILQSPNQYFSLGVQNRYVNIQNRSALGDFNNDGKLEIVLPQMEDGFSKNDPVYIFPLEVPAYKTQNIYFEKIESINNTTISYELIAGSTSGLPVSYEVVEGPVIVVGNMLKFNGEAGKVEIKAMQEGNDEFFPAESITQSFEIVKVSDNATSAIPELTAFPNPVKDWVCIRSEDLSSEQIDFIQIMTVSGQFVRQVEQYEQFGDILTFDMSQLKNGVYLINIQSHSEKVLLRVVKE